MMSSISGTCSVARGSCVGEARPRAAKSRCIEAMVSRVSSPIVMPRSTARRMILSSMSVMLRT
jgi:hypothetical protein